MRILMVLLAALWSAPALADEPAGERVPASQPASQPATQPAAIVLPADSGYVDIKQRYSAKGDGVADDTAAFASAIADGVRNLYIPPGTYLVSDELKFWPRKWVIQGAGRELTTIRLKDRCDGFREADKPKPVISTYAMTPGRGEWMQAFRSSVLDVTIDVGEGNAGAVGLHWMSNNQGAVRDVKIVSRDGSGYAGLASVTNWPGPGLVSRVEIEGFDYGIWVDGGQFGLTFEDITLRRQNKAGICNAGQAMFIRKLRSENAVPAIQHSSPWMLMVVLDARLTGGSADKPAIDAVSSVPVEMRDRYKTWLQKDGPALLVRDCVAEGYMCAIRSVVGGQEAQAPCGHIAEFVSHAPLSAGGEAAATLGLPVEDAPLWPPEPPQQWASVLDFGAKRIEGTPRSEDMFDSGPAIQKAIDSGKPVVYLPTGRYAVRTPLVIRGSARRIVGFESSIRGLTGSAKPLWRVEDGPGPVVIERLTADAGCDSACWVEQATTRKLVLRNMIMGGYRNTLPGELFVEDVSGGPWQLKGQHVWARQINPECWDEANIVNDGGVLWVLGLKTEGGRTAVITRNGGRTEVLGAFVYANRGARDPAAFVSEESDVAAAFINRNEFPQQLRHTVGGQTTIIKPDQAPTGRYCTKVPLCVATRPAEP
jgi:hypothetical protein